MFARHRATSVRGSSSPKSATEEDELTRSESRGIPELKIIAENKLDSLQDSITEEKIILK